MEVQLNVPRGADMSRVLAEYPDLWEEEGYELEEFQRFWIGASMEEDYGYDWLTHDEAVAFCGFAEGVVEGAECLIEGNGGWAQSMISRKDFSEYAMAESEKADRTRISGIYWKAFDRGQAVTPTPPRTE